MNIRTANKHDLAQLTQLRQEYQTILMQSDPRFTGGTYTPWFEQMQQGLMSSTACCMAAEADNGNITGYIAAHIQPDGIGIVDELVLDAHTYHGGLGRRLWYALREWFATQTVQCIHISVPRYHAVEQAFWRALGAVEWKDETCPPHLMWMIL